MVRSTDRWRGRLDWLFSLVTGSKSAEVQVSVPTCIITTNYTHNIPIIDRHSTPVHCRLNLLDHTLLVFIFPTFLFFVCYHD